MPKIFKINLTILLVEIIHQRLSKDKNKVYIDVDWYKYAVKILEGISNMEIIDAVEIKLSPNKCRII